MAGSVVERHPASAEDIERGVASMVTVSKDGLLSSTNIVFTYLILWGHTANRPRSATGLHC